MKYSLQIPKNKIIWILGYNHWGVLGITKQSNPQLQENGMSKKHLDMALQEAAWKKLKNCHESHNGASGRRLMKQVNEHTGKDIPTHIY